MELKFASTFVSSSLDQILAPSATFPIVLTPIVNQTAPLNTDGSSTFNVIKDELFTNESRYTFFYRTQTNVSVTISQSIFYVSNLQQPIARQAEVIFRCLLFTIVVLEIFGLLFVLVKLLLVPMFRGIATCLKKHRARRNRVEVANDLAIDVSQ
jgi:hypothetical protein